MPTSRPFGLLVTASTMPPLAMRPTGEGFEFVLVHAFEGHGVDLDGEARILRGLDAVENLLEIAPPRHGAELRRIEGVERDVDAPDPVSREIGRVFPEL